MLRQSLCTAATMLVLTAVPCLAAAPPADRILPAETQGMLSIPDIGDLHQRWDRTEFGQLLADPIMQPFVDDFRQGIADRRSESGVQLGINFADLERIAGGETAMAVIDSPADSPSQVLLVDVTGHEQDALEVLTRVTTNLKASQGVKDYLPVPVGDTQLTVFDLPVQPPAKTKRRVVYFLRGSVLGAVSDLGLAKLLAERLQNLDRPGLADSPEYKKVMDRLNSDVDGPAHTIRWFCRPFPYAEALQEMNQNERPDGPDRIASLKKAGFDSVKAAAGLITVADDKYDVLHRIAIHAPHHPAWEKSMQMLKLANAGNLLADETWVPADVATFTTLDVDVMNAFEHFGPLFDQTVGGGDEGVWAATLDSIKNDPFGPKIDMRAAVVENLDNHIVTLTDNKHPITEESERRLFALKIKSDNLAGRAKSLDQALSRLVDPETSKLHEIKGIRVWEMMEEDPEAINIPQIQINGPDGEKSVTITKKPREENEAICVAHGYLMYASHLSLLTKILENAGGRRSLARDPNYNSVNQKIDQELQRRGWSAGAMREFSTGSGEFELNYELARQGKVTRNQNSAATALSMAMGIAPGAENKPLINGSKLPDYQVARRYFLPSGQFMHTESDGWFFVGFTLKRPTIAQALVPGTRTD